MSKGRNRFSVTVWLAVAVGAVGVGVVLAFLGGYFLGHFTGHSTTTTIAITSSAEAAGETEEAPTEEAPAEEKTTEKAPAEESAPTEKAPAEEKAPGEKKSGEGGAKKEPAAAGNPAAGAEVFAANCAVCHGATGHGGSVGPDLRTMPLAQTESGAIKQVTDGGAAMPPFKGQLSEEEIKDVAAYVVQDIVGAG